MDRTTNSAEFKYIIVYRGSNKDIEQYLRELILPFTQSAYIWNHFISMVVLIDQDSGITFTTAMNEYFTKWVVPPITMINTVNCSIITQREQIREELEELFDDIERSTTLFEGFKSISDQNTTTSGGISEFYKPDIMTISMDQLSSEQYVNEKNQENMNYMQEYLNNNNYQQNYVQNIPQIKDTKSKMMNFQTVPLNASASINRMELTYQ